MSGALPGTPAERARSPVRNNDVVSRSHSLNRLPAGRASAPRCDAAPGGAALVAGLAAASTVSPASCSGRDRLWLPSRVAPHEGLLQQQVPGCSPAGNTLILTSAPASRPVDSAAVLARAPAPLEGTASVQTIRLPTPEREQRKTASSPTPLPNGASTPAAGRSGDPASAGKAPSEDNAVHRASAGRPPSKDRSIRRRPASAGGRLVAGKGAPSAAEIPAAGQRVRCDSPGHQQRARHCQEHGEGWSPKAFHPEEHLRHDPILHKVEVYTRSESGDVKRFGTHKGHYHEALKEAALRRQAGRRKGMAEFGDLCALGAPNWDPGHRAALEQDRHVFYRHRGECADFAELASKYPCQPKPFEPNRFMKCGGNDAPCPQRPAVPPPRRAEARTPSVRTRRPPSAGRRSVPASAAAPPTLVAPASSAKH